MPDPKTEDRSDDMEHDLHRLEDHIDEAEKKLQARKEDADIVDDVAGDWEGEQDRGGGDDPQGAETDAGQAAPGGSQDGPGTGTAPPREDDGDEMVEEEAAGPT